MTDVRRQVGRQKRETAWEWSGFTDFYGCKEASPNFNLAVKIPRAYLIKVQKRMTLWTERRPARHTHATFGSHFGTQNHSKINPKRVPKWNHFLYKFWDGFWNDLAPKMNPKSIKNRSKRTIKKNDQKEIKCGAFLLCSSSSRRILVTLTFARETN